MMKTSHLVFTIFFVYAPPASNAQHPEQPAHYSGIQYHPKISVMASLSKTGVKRESAYDMLKDFPLAENVKWSTVNNSHKAVFTSDDLITKAFFNADGTFSYALTNYPAERLPEEVLRNVYQTYKRYRIISAKEVKSAESSSFHLILENGSSYKTLKITNNNIEQIGKLRKEPEDQEVD